VLRVHAQFSINFLTYVFVFARCSYLAVSTLRFQALFLAGEHCDHETMDWAKDLLQTPVLDNWWQTG
jgi:acyl-coenzyme A synthetase/AMP-(fatty) acid ligase